MVSRSEIVKQYAQKNNLKVDDVRLHKISENQRVINSLIMYGADPAKLAKKYGWRTVRVAVKSLEEVISTVHLMDLGVTARGKYHLIN